MKYRVIFKKNYSVKHVIASGINLDEAFVIMKREAYNKMHNELEENINVQAEYTSDDRYPDCWGRANNGIRITSNCKTYLYLVEEDDKEIELPDIEEDAIKLAYNRLATGMSEILDEALNYNFYDANQIREKMSEIFKIAHNYSLIASNNGGITYLLTTRDDEGEGEISFASIDEVKDCIERCTISKPVKLESNDYRGGISLIKEW